MYADQYFIRLGGRFFNFFELKNVGWSISCAYNRFHPFSSCTSFLPAKFVADLLGRQDLFADPGWHPHCFRLGKLVAEIGAAIRPL